MTDSEFKLEQQILEKTINKFEELIEYYKLRSDAVCRIHANNELMMNNLLEMYGNKLRLMEINIYKPYFARLDFDRDGEKGVEKLYIGKVGVMDEDNHIITVDWRAPVAAMYYDSNVGRAKYDGTEGVCTGEILLKRQYEIENKELISFQDVDTVSNDDLLKPYLNASADNRLKNIVSTIQQEQNAIIREPISKNLIIQGVAGSGKTTVALHRIAYLVYNNRDYIKPNQYLVIGPNKFFVNYISGVLPDLDVEDVGQLTYDELCNEFIGEKLTLINEEEKLKKSISNEQLLKYEKFKVSMEFKNKLDLFLNHINDKIIPKKGIAVKGYEILSNKEIEEIYFSINNSQIYDSVKKKIDRTILLISKYILDNDFLILENINQQYLNNIESKLIENNRIEQDKIDFIKKELEKGCKVAVKRYFQNIIPSTLTLYKDFLKKSLKYLDNNEYEIYKSGIQKTLSNIDNGNIEFEDLSSLIYIQCKMYGPEIYEKYRHVAIDEAQDFGDFSFYALKYMLKNASFSIYGDLAQSISQYRGIKKWQEVINDSFDDKCEIKHLLKSYRTTTEIMKEANRITSFLKLDVAMPVIRHGENVKYFEYHNISEQIDKIIKTIDIYKQKGYNHIAIICKDEEEKEIINIELQRKGIKLNNITNSDTQYKDGINIITSYFVKGLEFDGVIITNASENNYDSNREINMKLLYVAMTRALHELTILYNDRLTKPLILL